jgi:YesN/AraC family two-component response regulator
MSRSFLNWIGFIFEKLMLLLVLNQSGYLLAQNEVNSDVKLFYSTKQNVSKEEFYNTLTTHYQLLESSSVKINSRLERATSLLKNDCDKLDLKIVRLNFLVYSGDSKPIAFLITEIKNQIDSDKYSCGIYKKTKAYRAIANAYYMLGDQAMARRYYFAALRKLKNEKSSIKSVLINIGITHHSEKNLDSALYYYKKAMKLEKEGVALYHINLLTNLAILYMDKKEYDKSLSCLYKADTNKINDISKAYIYLNIGKANIEIGDSEKALYYYSKALHFSKKTKNIEVQRYITQELVDYYAKTEQYQKAFYYNHQLDSLNAQKNIVNTRKLIDSLQFEHDLKIQKAEKGKLNQRLLYQTRQKNILAVAITLTVMFLGSIIYFLRKQNAKNKILVLSQLDAIPKYSNYHSTDLDEQVSEIELVTINDENKHQEIEISKILVEKLEKLLSNKELYKDPNISIQMLANKLNVNNVVLSKTINAYYKIPFRTLINNKRIELAKVLLLEESYQHYSIEGIGQTIGYLNKSTFYKNFKFITGVTPSFFQKEGMRHKMKIGKHSSI